LERKQKMEKEKTDQIFNAITANGCRVMDEERFHQAVNEVLAEFKIPVEEELAKKVIQNFANYYNRFHLHKIYNEHIEAFMNETKKP
jgi:hypothetical protein